MTTRSLHTQARTRFTWTRSAIVILAIAIGMAVVGSQACQAAAVFYDNQFNGTWNTSDGNPLATYAPNNVGDTFRNNSDAKGSTWTVTTLRPQPWNTGGVNFAGGGLTTGAITTEFVAGSGRLFTITWGADQFGGVTTHSLTATVYDGSGTGGPILGTQTLGINQDSSFSFVGTGNTATLEILLNVGTPNGGADIQLDYVTISAVPEPTGAMLSTGGLVVGILVRRRRRK